MTTPRTGVCILAFSLLVLPVVVGLRAVGSRRNRQERGRRAGGGENRWRRDALAGTRGPPCLRGRRAAHGRQGQALIETDERIQVALNGDSVVQILSRWEKARGVTRVLRVQRGEVWARIGDERRALEIETPVGVLAARVAEVNVRLVSDNETVATVVTGTGEFSTPFATCELRAGTTSFGHRSKACTPPAATGRCHGRRLEPTAATLTLMQSRATRGLRPPSTSHGPWT
jgi:hypothetical protein